MNILAIDPGTSTGWAWGPTSDLWPSFGGRWELGVGDLNTEAAEGRWVRRCVRFRRRLLEYQPDIVAFEHGFHRGRASELFAGLRWIIRMDAYDRNYSFASWSPAAVKKSLTGRGNATKEEMLAAAVDRWGRYAERYTHDQIDAVALWCLAREEMGPQTAEVPS